MPEDKALMPFHVPLDGKIILSSDPLIIGKNFRSLKNLRYTDSNPQGVGGMTKINTTALTTYLKIRNGFHYRKVQPAESHVLVQAYNTGLSASQVLQNITAIPSAGDFSGTALHTDSAGAGQGRFSDAPDGCMVYCNGVDTMAWGGDESRVASFIVVASDDSFSYDYTQEVNNTMTDSANVATITGKAGTPKTTVVYIGSILPLEGFKLYMGTVNTGTSTMAVTTWNGTTWTAVSSLSDGTASGGISLAQTGTVTFTSTVSTSKLTMYEGQLLYWYKVSITGTPGVADATTVYYATAKVPFQSMKDIWDGTLRVLTMCQQQVGDKYADYTVNMSDEGYIETNSATYMNLGGMTASDYLYFGFDERVRGMYVTILDNYANNVAATMSLSYWNGSAWTTLTITDNTSSNSKSFAKSGFVLWEPPASTAEFRKSTTNSPKWFSYRMSFSATLSNGDTVPKVITSFIGGVPVQSDIDGYKFSMYADDRVYLCCNTKGRKNEILVSKYHTVNAFNGGDSAYIYIGDSKELTSATSLYARVGDNIYNIKLFFKASEVWEIAESSPKEFKAPHKILSEDGCPAPLTLDTGIIEINGYSRSVAIWQGANGIYMYDNNAIVPIHSDINIFFDRRNSSCINASKLKDSFGYIDPVYGEYHWLFAKGTETTLDNEWVFDIKRKKWFEIDRGAGKRIQCAFTASDTNDNIYTYGCIDTGYMERLEYGTAFDGTAIAHDLYLGDFPIGEEGLNIKTKLRHIMPIIIAKATTTNSMTITHYGDSSTTGATWTQAVSSTGKRLNNTIKSHTLGDYIFHSLRLQMTTNNETIGFEPLAITGFYQTIGRKLI